MSFEDRDWYRNEHTQKTAQRPDLLQHVIDRTEKHRRIHPLFIACAWIAAIAALYLAFKLAGR